MALMTDYRGRLSDHERSAVRGLLVHDFSVRAISRELELPYGQVRGYCEWLQNQENKVITDLLDPPHSPRLLVIDIETTPNLAWTWGFWKQNIIDIEQYWYMLSFAYAWYDLERDTIGETGFVGLNDDPTFVPDTDDDRYVVDRMWSLLDQADIVIGQNSKSFDTKKFNSRAIIHGYTPPASYQQIDTKRAAQEVGQFGSNSLKHLARMLGISLKEENRGFPMWREAMAGEDVAWAEMEVYNKADVQATAELYTTLRPWMTGRNHPNLGLYIASEGMVCTRCGNKERDHGGQGFQYRGDRYTNASAFKEVRCNKCGAYSREYRRHPQRTPYTTVDLRP
jgi:hypothetical protein